jgi:hypothetical protein
MFVRDLPLAVNPLETECVPKPEVAVGTVDLRSVHPIYAVTKSNVGTDLDA